MYRNDLWTVLKDAKKPIVIYGMGDGCDKILAVCEKKGIPIRGIFASDGYVRSKTVHGFALKTLDQILQENGDVIALLAFGVFREELMQTIREVAKKVELYVPEVPLFGDELFDLDYYLQNKDKIETVRAFLSDEKSQEVFDGWLDYKLGGRPEALWKIESDRENDLRELVAYRSGDHYLDLGAYDGDTALEWARLHPDYGKITAFEPNPKTYRKLVENCAALRDFQAIECAAWKENTHLSFQSKSGRSASVAESGTVEVRAMAPDSLLQRVDFIKMDVEGAECEAIEGCRRLIEEEAPDLCISAYHRSQDLFAIPLQVKAIRPDYRVFVRHSPYLPAWDTFFYFSAR